MPAPFQVDATKMEAFVENFVGSLGLSRQYTIVVLNPTWSSGEAAYGYRTGMSQKELDVVAREREELMRLLQVWACVCSSRNVCVGGWVG